MSTPTPNAARVHALCRLASEPDEGSVPALLEALVALEREVSSVRFGLTSLAVRLAPVLSPESSRPSMIPTSGTPESMTLDNARHIRLSTRVDLLRSQLHELNLDLSDLTARLDV